MTVVAPVCPVAPLAENEETDEDPKPMVWLLLFVLPLAKEPPPLTANPGRNLMSSVASRPTVESLWMSSAVISELFSGESRLTLQQGGGAVTPLDTRQLSLAMDRI